MSERKPRPGQCECDPNDSDYSCSCCGAAAGELCRHDEEPDYRAHAAALAKALWEVRGLWADHIHHRPDCQLERRAGPCDCRAGAAAKRADAALAAYKAAKGGGR